MGATTNSPNTGNYFIGKGNVYFTPIIDGVYTTERHMGNVPQFQFTPNVDTLEHFSSMQGVKTKDFEIITTLEGTLAITLEEYTPNNLAIGLLGAVDVDAEDGPEIDVFAVSEVRGKVRLEGTNDYGAKINATFYNVQFTPNGDIGFITDELGQIELEGSVQPDQMAGATNGKFGLIKFTNVVAPVASDLVSISPTTGAAAGGTAVVVTGTGFINATGVTFGGVAGTGFSVINDTTIHVTTPAHGAGAVAVVVQDVDGADAGLPTGYTYT